MMGFLHRHIFTWRAATFFLGALVFWWIAFPPLFRVLVPPERYLDVRAVLVSDAVAGQSPTVFVDRTVNRDFLGGFIAEVRRVDEADGTIWTYCPPAARTEIPYKAGSPYPGRDLSWWLGSPPAEACDLTPGKYILRIRWTIHAFFGLIDLHMQRETPTPFAVIDPMAAYAAPVGLPPELQP